MLRYLDDKMLTKKVEEGRLELDEIVFLGSGGRHHEVVLTILVLSCHKSYAVLTAMYFILEKINYYIVRW